MWFPLDFLQAAHLTTTTTTTTTTNYYQYCIHPLKCSLRLQAAHHSPQMLSTSTTTTTNYYQYCIHPSTLKLHTTYIFLQMSAFIPSNALYIFPYILVFTISQRKPLGAPGSPHPTPRSPWEPLGSPWELLGSPWEPLGAQSNHYKS